MVKVRAMRTLENALRRYGFHRIAGVDEVGRGCLAGPVVAAAVVLDPGRYIPGIHDSKMVTALERERLYGVITRKALAWSVAAAQPAEIDDINIHRASLEAMRRAVMTLAPLPDLVLVDAFRIPELLMAQRGVVHGDRRCTAIAAASIVAKVTRDREMLVHHGRTRATATTGTRATRRPTTWPRWRDTAIRRCTGARSGHPRCLIRLTSRNRETACLFPPRKTRCAPIDLWQLIATRL